MAQNLPYTLLDIQTRIEILVNNDTDVPATTDDEWTTRLGLINQAIGNHESQDVFWDEFWNTYTHGTLVTALTTTYTLTALTDMRFPGGLVQLVLNGVTTYVPVISSEEYQTFHGEQQVVYFTGNIGSTWTLNLGWTPRTGDNTVGATIKIPYYKTAARLSATTDKPEMLDPNYIIYWVAAQKSLLESKNNQYTVFSTEALNCMDRMRIMNDIKPNFNNNSIQDLDALMGGVIGE